MWPWLLIYFGHQATNTMRFLSYSVASGGAGWSAEVELMEWPGAALSRGAGGGTNTSASEERQFSALHCFGWG